MKTVVINGKWPVKMHDHRAARAEWTTEQGWERKRLNSMGDRIGLNDVVYYVGAELGEMPALCQIWGAKVAMFEPNHTAWPVIKGIWEANNLEKPLLNFAGFASNITQLTPKNADWTMRKSTPWRNDDEGWPRYCNEKIVKDHGFSELYLEADGLPQVKLDDCPSLFNIPPPTALIIDVEGSEWEVLRGTEKILKEYHPKIWLSVHPELLMHHFNEYSRDLRNWLQDIGYSEEFIDYEHEVHFLYEDANK